MQNFLKYFAVIKGLVDHIEENVAEEINIIDLAKSSQMSPWHFQRLFSSMIGDSLGGYVRGRRLSIAAQMLLNTEFRMIDIAFHVGFQSHESFSRAFKSYFQVSPKEFKKSSPSIVIKNKPLITEELFEHMALGIQHVPEIKHFKEQQILGLETTIPSPFVSEENICEMIADSWMKMWAREAEIKNRTLQEYFGLTLSPSGNFTEDRLVYVAGVPVTQGAKVPNGMKSYIIPDQQVAVFDVTADIIDDSLKKTVDYIYGYWLPKSPYERGQGDDFGFFEGEINFEDPNSLQAKYAVPVVSV